MWEGIQIAHDILGSSMVGWKGKTVQKQEKHVCVEVAALPDSITEGYSRVEMGADIMYVKGIQFFITISCHIQFGTTVARMILVKAKADTLQECITDLQPLNSKRSFSIKVLMNMDTKFWTPCYKYNQYHNHPKLVSKDKHVLEVERYICTIKEQVRGIQCTLPCKHMSWNVTIELLASQVFWWQNHQVCWRQWVWGKWSQGSP